ncbi:thioesterase family protein [Nocardioides carbamazepini]|uniref:acyl-CoA thioesterase n=1 Tax=Nocardioides carbamazepini TaxID=2854259 RepID=UPI002149C99D|nr:acyl-CoA thioesterase domain-containing protein [Nocardioides carbamazepini]MCR1783672.1 thioesterase family protein [Nocardioides carbamazepini]
MVPDVNNQAAPAGRLVRTSCTPIGTGLVPGNEVRAFGGSTLALLLRAAAGPTDAGQRPHSLHAHFLAPASPADHLDLPVRVLSRSPSFTTVAIEAVQPRGTVATATASFHRPRPSRGHATTTTPPSSAPREARPAEGGPIPGEHRPSRRDFDLRFADTGPVPGPDGRPLLRYWVRYRADLSGPLEQAVALTWVSDLCLTRVADLEHESSPGRRQAASLDHAAWYHRPFDIRQWLLYETSSPSYADEVALSTGRFFADGELVATSAQQSLLRRTV